MKKTLRNTLIILLMIASVFSFFSCSSTEAAVEAPVTATVKRKVPVKPEAPKLDVEVTPEMDFFKDGYEIVTVDTLADGDTTTFNLKSGKRTTRYLAVDTPETSNGVEPWGMAAKKFVNNLLSNAKQIVLERDPMLFNDEDGVDNSTLDKYGRLLAHVWVDGELVQYKVVEESLGAVTYLYYDYKYNDILIELEKYVQRNDHRRIHNRLDKDPDYDYSDNLYTITMDELTPEYINKRVEVTGIVSGVIGQNAYMQNADGTKGIYIYTNHNRFKALKEVGNEVTYTGRYTIYNDIPELGSPEVAPVLISTGNEVVSTDAVISDVNKENMGRLLNLRNVTCLSADKGKARFSDETGEITVHINYDTELDGTALFEVGKTYDVLGNVSVFKDEFQLELRYDSDVVEVQ